MVSAPLDPHKTAPFALGPEDGAPCLVLHGFTGTPWDVRPLAEGLAAEGYRATAIRLPGHGTTPEAMLEVRAQDWLEAAEQALRAASEREPVRIAGLSMGALLALRLAAQHPDRVRGLALLAPAMRFQGPSMALLRALRHTSVAERLLPWVKKNASDIEDSVARAAAPTLPRFPMTRLRDLFALQDLAEETLARVRAPTLVLFAPREHVVSKRGTRRLMRGLSPECRAQYREVREGFHILPRDFGRDQVLREVLDFYAAL